MSKPRITLNVFSPASIKRAQAQLKAYKAELISKCETFVRELSKAGIDVAEQNTGSFGKYITFKTEVNPQKYGYKAVMVASNTGLIKSEWRINSAGDTKTADVSPILMAEFGSGLRADSDHARPFGMGTGTFPEQTHAEDPDGWWYQTLDEVWHHSYGVTPTYPMMSASAAMTDAINTVAKSVFG